MRAKPPARAEGPALGAMVAFLGALWAAFQLFRVFDWGHGLLRLGLLGAVGVLVFGADAYARRRRPVASAPAARRGLVTVATIACALALSTNVAVGVASVRDALAAGDVRLDQGQSCWRAVKMLMAGANPYGYRVLLDQDTYSLRTAARIHMGIRSTSGADDEKEQRRAFADWSVTGDPAVIDQLLPPLDPATRTSEQVHEYKRYGFKYGPNLLLLIGPFVIALGAAGDAVFNLVCYVAFTALFFKILPLAGITDALGRLVVVFVLLADVTWTMNFLWLSATDIACLAVSFLALILLFRERRLAAGALMAVAFGIKSIPALLLFPMLLRKRAFRAIAMFACVIGVTQLPWLFWDSFGFVYNTFLHGAIREPDSTSWIHDVPRGPMVVGKLAGLALASTSAWKLVMARGEPPWRWLVLLGLAVVGSSSQIHNNYLTWFSAFAYVSIGVSFCGQGAQNGREVGESSGKDEHSSGDSASCTE